jgi:hypothetical protein
MRFFNKLFSNFSFVDALTVGLPILAVAGTVGIRAYQDNQATAAMNALAPPPPFFQCGIEERDKGMDETDSAKHTTPKNQALLAAPADIRFERFINGSFSNCDFLIPSKQQDSLETKEDLPEVTIEAKKIRIISYCGNYISKPKYVSQSIIDSTQSILNGSGERDFVSAAPRNPPINLYPNPANGLSGATLEGLISGYTLTDAQGRIITRQTNVSSDRIQIGQGLTPGRYILVVTLPSGKVESRTLIIGQ